MALSRQDVKEIAHLARLEVSEDELTDYVTKLSSILEMFTRLGEVDMSSVTPMAHPMEMVQRLRPDEVTETDRRDEFQKNSADVTQGLYRVPRVIE